MTRARELADAVGKPQGDKNFLINGAMELWQRTTAATVSTDIYSTLDRWKTRVSNIGAFAVSRSSDVPSGEGFLYSTKYDCSTADASPAAGDFNIFEQRIESVNLINIKKGTPNADALTLSFWVKSNKTGTYIASIYDAINDRRISKAYTVDSSGVWEKKSVTFPGDTGGGGMSFSVNVGFYLQMWLGAGSNYTSGTLATSWQANTDAIIAPGQTNLADSTSNELYFTGFQLELGEVASNFQFESYPTLLKKCQRYYFKPHNSSYGWQGRRGGGRLFRVNNRTQGTLEFPVTMRAAPSFSASRGYGDGIWGSASIYAGNGWSNPTAPDYVNIEANIDVNSGGGNGGTFGFSVNVSAEL